MTVLIQARVEEQDKASANTVLEALGLDMSTYIRMCVHRLAQKGALPDEFMTPNATTIAALEETKRGGGERFGSIDALMTDLNADD